MASTCAAALLVAALPGASSAQWLDYPTPGVPRTADGKPNLSAPTPRTAERQAGLERHVGLGNPRELRRPLQRFSALSGVHEHRRESDSPPVYQPGVADLVKKF